MHTNYLALHIMGARVYGLLLVIVFLRNLMSLQRQLGYAKSQTPFLFLFSKISIASFLSHLNNLPTFASYLFADPETSFCYMQLQVYRVPYAQVDAQ